MTTPEEKLYADMGTSKHEKQGIKRLHAEHQLLLLATFVDFSRAFDSINQKALFRILRHYGIPSQINDAITAMYTNS